jgi:putative membrane protein
MRPLTRNLCLIGAVTLVAATVLPPLGRLGDELFSIHMLQHLLLIVVAAPLLVLAGVWRPAIAPVAAWAGFVGTFLFWHWPAAFQWAALHETAQLFEFGSILLTAFLFWNVALTSERLSHGARALFVMMAAVATDLPGVIMVFSPRALCTMPGENALHWGVTPLQDQQIAGLLMWVPANLAFFSIATWLFARWISNSPHKLVIP